MTMTARQLIEELNKLTEEEKDMPLLSSELFSYFYIDDIEVFRIGTEDKMVMKTILSDTEL